VTEWSQVPAVARPLPEPEPQPVLAPLTNSAIFLVLTINDSGEEVVRDLLSDWTGLQFAGPRPAELHPFAEISGTVHRAVSTGGDLLLHIRHDRMDLCFEFATQVMARLATVVTVADEVHGFRYFDERDLLGFVDGTENPVGRAAGTAALTGDADPDFAGATSSCRSTCTTWRRGTR
jgi:putative iron-dependent peroxidase